MTELQPGARLVVQLAKRGDAPERTDRERVREALERTLRGDSLPTPVLLKGAARRRGRAPVGAWVAAAILTLSAAAVAAGATAVAQRWNPGPTATPPVELVDAPGASTSRERTLVVPVEPVSTVEEVLDDPPPQGQLTTSLPAAPRPIPQRPRPPTLTLAEEAGLLRQARDALASGRLEAAASALADHRRLAPAGALAEDREALRVLVNCRRHRSASEAAGFARRWPGSAHEARLTAECGTAEQ